MKTIPILLTVALLICTNYDASAQTKKKEAQKKTRTTNKTMRHTETRPPEKSINTGTTGVLGQDTIQLNEKGMELNKNYNTGTELPPSNGNNPKK